MKDSMTPDDDVISRIVEALKAAQESAFADLRLAVASDQHKGEYNFLKDNYLGGISKGLEQAVEIIESLPTAAPVVPSDTDFHELLQNEFEEAWTNIRSVEYESAQGNWWRGFAAGIDKAQEITSPVTQWTREKIDAVIGRIWDDGAGTYSANQMVARQGAEKLARALLRAQGEET